MTEDSLEYIALSIESDDWLTHHPNWEEFFYNILEKVTSTLHIKTMYTLSILLTDNAESQRLNRDFRHKDKPTNVLSFPAAPMTLNSIHSDQDPSNKGSDEILEMPPSFLGDLAFAYGIIATEASYEDKTFLNHMTHLTIHGILHLLGYDHETLEEANTMETLEIQILNQLNIRNPYV